MRMIRVGGIEVEKKMFGGPAFQVRGKIKMWIAFGDITRCAPARKLGGGIR